MAFVQRVFSGTQPSGDLHRGNYLGAIKQCKAGLKHSPDSFELHVEQLFCLRKMGAQIDGEGTSTITIQGVDRLHGATHPVVTDRIELGTYMLVPAICGGEVECLGGRMELVGAFAEKLDAAPRF